MHFSLLFHLDTPVKVKHSLVFGLESGLIFPKQPQSTKETQLTSQAPNISCTFFLCSIEAGQRKLKHSLNFGLGIRPIFFSHIIINHERNKPQITDTETAHAYNFSYVPPSPLYSHYLFWPKIRPNFSLTDSYKLLLPRKEKQRNSHLHTHTHKQKAATIIYWRFLACTATVRLSFRFLHAWCLTKCFILSLGKESRTRVRRNFQYAALQWLVEWLWSNRILD